MSDVTLNKKSVVQTMFFFVAKFSHKIDWTDEKRMPWKPLNISRHNQGVVSK